MRGLSGAELQAALLAKFHRHGWSERPLEVIGQAAPASVAAFRFHAASSLARDLAPWPAGRVTALGDAVHATPPTAGMGAGAAIRDAASLLTHLCEVAAGTTTLTVAISQFAAGMRVRGSEVLTLARKTVRWILATDTALGAAVTAVATPVIAAGSRLKRQR
ncbi:FAD binding domain-containing protein [Amycolatopsis arida]|uniref:FAD binding domain-containing protein n=1 Tax=Amycolatopsis arida TaxID=587909 RepID=A0A1I5ZG28_9PSEU|nr:FAD binding domain-containing protein [Amycolatopsis arida]SFQ55067.1 FAD binding domain-containing protein [Amycolatopsis arida]